MGTSGGGANDIFSDEKMENMPASESSRQDLFEDAMWTRKEALLTKFDGIKQEMITMDERQESMYSMIKDIHSQYGFQPLGQWSFFLLCFLCTVLVPLLLEIILLFDISYFKCSWNPFSNVLGSYHLIHYMFASSACFYFFCVVYSYDKKVRKLLRIHWKSTKRMRANLGRGLIWNVFFGDYT